MNALYILGSVTETEQKLFLWPSIVVRILYRFIRVKLSVPQKYPLSTRVLSYFVYTCRV